MNKKLTISVPGKIHLMGEHAVVYGKPALLAAINLRVSITVEGSDKKVLSDTGNKDLVNALKLQKTVESIIKKRFKIKNISHYKVHLHSEIPIGFGLGSSAAISAAYSAALLSYLKIRWDLKLINELSYEAEKIFHGNPSGGDNTAVVYGGFLWYRKELETLKVFHSIQQKIHKNIKSFILINSGKPVESTGEMVVFVKFKIQNSKFKIKKIFDEQEEITKKVLTALLAGDENMLIESIKKGERNLEKIGVVGKLAQSIIRKIEKIGGAAKITGAGGCKSGSGMLVAYHKTPQTLIGLSNKMRLPFLHINMEEEGLRKEK